MANRYNRKHGQSVGGKQSSTYMSWADMKKRCLNPNQKNYSEYGGRGIKICERWLDFSNFLADMGEKPTKYHQIDRIDNDGDYEPSNCKWSTRQEQCNNRRNTRLVTYNGKSKPLRFWANELGFSYEMVRLRLKRGWPVERAFTWHC